MSTLTGAPAALAFALGCQEAINGVATPTAPTVLSAVVAPTKNFRRDVSAGCCTWVTTASVTIPPIDLRWASFIHNGKD